VRFISFFAGIGGFDLGLERAGHECVGQVEIDPYAIRVLERHWPNVPRFGDIRTLDAATLPDADIWCGGFPCQPFSVAGKRGATDDERDLWPAWFSLISRRRPRWIFGENVAGLLSAEGGKAWGRVLRDLASVGYVGEWTVLAARDVGAPHRRERLWIVAELADGDRGRLEIVGVEEHAELVRSLGNKPDGCDPRRRRDGEGVADAEGLAVGTGLRADEPTGERRRRSNDSGRPQCWCGRGEPWCCDPADRPTQPRLGRVAHGIPSRVHRLRCLGNAVVPQVVEAIANKVWTHKGD